MSYLLPAALSSEQMLPRDEISHHLALQENFQVALASCIVLDTQLESSLLVDK